MIRIKEGGREAGVVGMAGSDLGNEGGWGCRAGGCVLAKSGCRLSGGCFFISG
jgi:hypothetical protein